jgi:tRNA-splicing ligase RtcB
LTPDEQRLTVYVTHLKIGSIQQGATMKTHKLLDSYHHRTDFPEIAQAVARWAKTNPHATPAEVLAWVETNYGGEQWLTIADTPAPFTMFGAPGAHIPYSAVEQMETVMRVPVARRGALMPDAHLGYAMPIGGVVSLEEAISPSFVGYDISCMMQLSLFDLTSAEFMKHRRKFAAALRSQTAFGLGAGFKPGQRPARCDGRPALAETRLLRTLKATAGQQLGSSGGGNHFTDLVLVDFVRDHEVYRAGEQTRRAVDAQREPGRRAQDRHALRRTGRPSTHARSPARFRAATSGWRSTSSWGRNTLAAMQLMGAYARANHDLIHDHFVAAAGVGQRSPRVESPQLRVGGGRRRHPPQGRHARRTWA